MNQDIPYLTMDSLPQKGKKPPVQSMDLSAAPIPSPCIPVELSHQTVCLTMFLYRTTSNNSSALGKKELLRAGIVNIHSKVIMLDPFGENPVVMTGSHNLGFKASSKNDDNLIIIEGNGPLAAAYAVNIIAIFQSYRWNHCVTQPPQ